MAALLPQDIWIKITSYLHIRDVIYLSKTCRAIREIFKRKMYPIYMERLLHLHRGTRFVQILNELRRANVPFIITGRLVRFAKHGAQNLDVNIFRLRDTDDTTPQSDFRSLPFIGEVTRGCQILHHGPPPSMVCATTVYHMGDVAFFYYYPEAQSLFTQELSGDAITNHSVYIDLSNMR